ACAPVPEPVTSAHAEADEVRPICPDLGAPAALPPPPIAQAQSAPPAPSRCPSCAPPPAPELPAAMETIAPSSQPRSIRVHFPRPDEPYRDCRAHPWVTRTVPAGASPVDFALAAVIKGPTPFEQHQGLYSPYERSTSDPDALPLNVSQVK